VSTDSEQTYSIEEIQEFFDMQGLLNASQMGQFVDADQMYSGLVPQGYSLEFMYPFDMDTGENVWEMTPPFAPPAVGPGVLEGTEPIGPDTPHAFESDVSIMRAYTMRDEIDKYLTLVPGSAEQEALAETLWSNNFYQDGTSRDEMLRPRHIDSAFMLGVEWGARQGVSIWEMEAGPGREDTAATALTDASIYHSAETAAKQSFGRSATSAEKQMAVKISRALEAAGVPVSRADIAAELETGAPDEVKARDMSTTLRYLMKAMAGRGAS
jgi:hypothetical protein